MGGGGGQTAKAVFGDPTASEGNISKPRGLKHHFISQKSVVPQNESPASPGVGWMAGMARRPEMPPLAWLAAHAGCWLRNSAGLLAGSLGSLPRGPFRVAGWVSLQRGSRVPRKRIPRI